MNLNATSSQIQIRYQPQDPMTTSPVDAVMEATPNLSNSRMSIEDKVEPARPDANGNFLFQPGTPEFQQANTYVAANKTLAMFEKALGHKIAWAFEGDLKLHPHFGEGFNAFYLRQQHSLNFFDGADDKMGKTIAGSESLDVVSHETGHAILDGLKPGLIGWFGSGEAPAFHESFGDMAAMLTALQDDQVLDKLVAQTGGDLHKPNLVARLAEEMSRGINDVYLKNTRPDDWVMRDANNDLKYQPPASLPEKAPPEALTAEPHSFGRIFTGAFWDILSDVNDGFRQKGLNPREAIIAAREVATTLLARGVELGPNRLNHLSQMAEAMVKADERYCGSQYGDIIRKAMASRNLLGESIQEGPPFDIGHAPSSLDEADKLLGEKYTGDLKAEALWKNDRGETFVRFDSVKEVPLNRYLSTDLASSLTLGIDSQNQLFHALWEPVDKQAVDLARQEVQNYRQREGATDIERGYLSQKGPGHEKVVKIPRI